ncbi:heterocycloanthracin/sonorensin family bacteriocin [Peribacillus sp. NPDC096379]|uniref:heterocycloanthracin/sonorensin family bacteriocin n=1 Tax=Peribacillus sp. NPDC096379 TaxID=3364393 RepID=UPI00380BB148
MLNFQNDLQTLGMDNFQVGQLIPMGPQSQDSRIIFGGMRCGGMMCGGMRCGGMRCGGFRCFGCFGCFGCGGCGGCYSGYNDYDDWYNY